MSGWKKLAAASAGGEPVYVDNIFSPYSYAANYNSTNNVVNGVDLATYGGAVWITPRTSSFSGYNEHYIFDTERGSPYYLKPNSTSSEANDSKGVKSYNSDGFTVGFSIRTNYANYGSTYGNYASFSFAKHEKFFDIVTYTGNGATSQNISHSLNGDVGFILVKSRSATGSWYTFHRSYPTQRGQWNSTNAFNSSTAEFPSAPTSSVITVGGENNINNVTYVAYLFGHNDGNGIFGESADEDIIHCGTVTLDGNGNGSVDIGFPAGYVITKEQNNSGNPWYIYDCNRGMSRPHDAGTVFQTQLPSTAGNESGAANKYVQSTPEGFDIQNYTGSANIAYIAIRRPMKVPETSGEFFDIGDTSTTTGKFAPAFQMDFSPKLTMYRGNRTGGDYWQANTVELSDDRYANWGQRSDEGSASAIYSTEINYYGNGQRYGKDTDFNNNNLGYFWDIRKGAFDITSWTHNNTYTPYSVTHKLGVVPEMMWLDAVDNSADWYVYHKDIGNAGYVRWPFDSVNLTGRTLWDTTTPTSTQVFFGDSDAYGDRTYNLYLFASLAGISKVGSYTGDGTTNGSKVIDCGFSAGVKFVMIRPLVATGDGYSNNFRLYDTIQGISSSSSPYLQVSQPAASTSSTDIGPDSSGFTVKSSWSNASGTDYIYYAVAN